MPALQHFFDAERQRRGWSVREAADRCRISVSKAYAIVNGDDNVELETFENIASAFDMTPADLAIAMGKGSPDHDPDEVEMLVVYRQVPAEQRPFIQRALRGLIEPAVPVPPTRPGRRRVTQPPEEFGKSNPSEIQQVAARRKPYESQSVASMIERFGFHPMHV